MCVKIYGIKTRGALHTSFAMVASFPRPSLPLLHTSLSLLPMGVTAMGKNQKKDTSSSSSSHSNGSDGVKVKRTKRSAARDSSRSQRSSVYRGVTRSVHPSPSISSLRLRVLIDLLKVPLIEFSSSPIGIGGRDDSRLICGIRTAGINPRTRKGNKACRAPFCWQIHFLA